MVGVAPDDDDDGNAASGTMTPAGRAQTSQRAAPRDASPFDEAPAPRATEAVEKPAPTDFWKRSSLSLDPKNNLTLEDFAKKMAAAIEAAPDEKALNKLVRDNDTRIDACGTEGIDLSENISARFGRLMAA